jgi:hypothetical protein
MAYSDAALDAFNRDRNGNCCFVMRELVAHVSDQAKECGEAQWAAAGSQLSRAERRQAICCF